MTYFSAFTLRFMFIPDTKPWCGGIQTESQGWLVAENKNYDCLWTIVAPLDSIIEIEIRSVKNMGGKSTCFPSFIEVN